MGFQQSLVETEQRLAQLEAKPVLAAATSPHQPLIEALYASREIGLVLAAMPIAELAGLWHFCHPREVMAYVGPVPSEHSSGTRSRRGRISTSGNSALRHVLGQAAWCHRHAPREGPTLWQR